MIQIFNDPWPYVVVENFLSDSHFRTLSQSCINTFKNNNDVHNHSTTDYGMDDAVLRHALMYDPVEDYNVAGYLHYFSTRRPYKELKRFVNFCKTAPNFEHPMHVEAPFKIMSCVLYLSPEESGGTRLFRGSNRDEDFSIEMEWKPNTMFIFCGADDVTWHDYYSTDEDRYTFNYFLVDQSIVQNEEFKKQCF